MVVRVASRTVSARDSQLARQSNHKTPCGAVELQSLNLKRQNEIGNYFRNERVHVCQSGRVKISERRALPSMRLELYRTHTKVCRLRTACMTWKSPGHLVGREGPGSS